MEYLRLLESVVVNANDAVLITQAEPIDLPGPRIVYCNAAFTRMTGYAEAEILGRTPRLMQSSKTDRAALARLRMALSQWKPVEVTLLNCRKDGTEFWVELSIVPVANEDGWFTHWVSVQRDVTDRKANEEVANRARIVEAENLVLEAEIEQRKRVEAELETKVADRTRELSQANARLQAAAEERERVEEVLRQSNKMEALGQLTGGLAHDFNNLLTGISGSLELIRTRVLQGRAAELERYIEIAFASTNRAAALTHRLLAFARRQTLDPKPTNVNQLVGGMAELFSHTMGLSIRIETRLASRMELILCDSNQLESALLNLVINARDAMPDGGRVVIETEDVVLPDRHGEPKDMPAPRPPPGDYVALSVTDTGTGMTPDVLARAFDPFFTTKPLGQGTGLGLSMIYGFVQQSGGHVQLRSDKEQGTRVTIYFPRYFEAPSDEASVDRAVPLPAAATSAVVLVVEDEPPVRMIVVDLLSDLGYTVLEAGDGRDGLSIVESAARIDLLLTDVGLPGGLNGRQLADAARQRRPDLKVLFMTGYDAGVVSNGLLDKGMQVMTKPFELNVLAARVHRIMHG